MIKTLNNQCPCGLETSYDQCCGAIHIGKSVAKTAESLMRSRYSAFVKADGVYLQSSHHSDTRVKSKSAQKDTVTFAKSVTWMKLEVLETVLGSESETTGIVAFKAYYIQSGKVEIIAERSTFRKEDGIWYYYDGKTI